jgi:cytochrome P450
MILRILQLIGYLVLLLGIRDFLQEYNYKRNAKKHGCKVPVYVQEFPFGIPAVWRMRRANDKHRVLQYLNYQFICRRKYTARFQTLFKKKIITIEPDNLKTVLSTSFKDYSLGVRHPQLMPLLGNGIFTLSGDGWKHSRQMLRPQFSREQVSQLHSLNIHVQNLVNLFKSRSNKATTTDSYFDCQEPFHNLTLDTATEFLFGESTNSLLDYSLTDKQVIQETKVTPLQFAHAFNDCLKYLTLRTQVSDLYWLVDSWKFRKSIKTVHKFVDYFVSQSLKSDRQAIESDEEEIRYVFMTELAKETRDPIVIRDQSLNVLLAGRDTTASLLSFTIFELGINKRVWYKLRDIVLEEFGTSPGTLTFENLKRCQYLSSVIHEVLRLHPSVPLNFREAIRDTVLPKGGGGDESESILVEEGTMVVYSVHVLHRLKRFWGEDADSFNPERWEASHLHTWDYLPFNGGPRICIGQQFALTEASFALVRILQEFKDVELDPDIKDPDIAQTVKLTTSSAVGIPVRFLVR